MGAGRGGGRSDEVEGMMGGRGPPTGVGKGDAGGGPSPGRDVGPCFFWRFGSTFVLVSFFGGKWGVEDRGTPP